MNFLPRESTLCGPGSGGPIWERVVLGSVFPAIVQCRVPQGVLAIPVHGMAQPDLQGGIGSPSEACGRRVDVSDSDAFQEPFRYGAEFRQDAWLNDFDQLIDDVTDWDQLARANVEC